MENFAHGGAGQGGGLGAGVELGGYLDKLGAEEAEFHSNGAEGRRHGLEFAAEGDAVGAMKADAEGGGLGEKDFRKFFAFVVVAEDGENEPGAVFFHLGRGEKNVEGAVFEEALHGSACEFGAEVVKVGLNLADGVRGCGVGGCAEDEAEGIGAGWGVTGSQSITGRLNLHGGHGPEAGGKLGEDGSARRRDKLGRLLDLSERDAGEDFESGWGGQRKPAVRAIDPARALD